MGETIRGHQAQRKSSKQKMETKMQMEMGQDRRHGWWYLPVVLALRRLMQDNGLSAGVQDQPV
jgi:hypothetical protein